MTGMQAPKKDFRALRRKLASGKTLAEAAAEAGMTEEEAKAYLTARESEEDETLRAFSDQAMKTALEVLERAAREKNRGLGQKLTELGPDGPLVTETKEQVIDVDAAKTLLRYAMQAKKMLRDDRDGRGSGGDQAGDRDLFDQGPWTFRKSD